MFTGLAHMWMHVDAAQGPSGLLQIPRESGCCSLGHAGAWWLFFSEARADPAVPCGVFFLSSDAKISLLAHSSFQGVHGTPADGQLLLAQGCNPLVPGRGMWTLWVAGRYLGQNRCMGRTDGNGMLGQDPQTGGYVEQGDCRLPQTLERVGWKN